MGKEASKSGQFLSVESVMSASVDCVVLDMYYIASS